MYSPFLPLFRCKNTNSLVFKTVKLGIEVVINQTIRLKPQEQNGRFNANFVSLTDTPTGPKPAILKWGEGGQKWGLPIQCIKGEFNTHSW